MIVSKRSDIDRSLSLISTIGIEMLVHPYNAKSNHDLIELYLDAVNKVLAGSFEYEIVFELDKDNKGICFNTGEKANLKHVYFKGYTHVINTAHNFIQECIDEYFNLNYRGTRFRNFISGLVARIKA